MTVERVASDTARGVTRAVSDTVKRVWSVLDAASEKPAPSQYLSPKTVRAIQGTDTKKETRTISGKVDI